MMPKKLDIRERKVLTGDLAAATKDFSIEWGTTAACGTQDVAVSADVIRVDGAVAGHLVTVMTDLPMTASLAELPWVLRNQHGVVCRVGHTDNRGQFRISDLPPGRYRLRFQRIVHGLSVVIGEDAAATSRGVRDDRREFVSEDRRLKAGLIISDTQVDLQVEVEAAEWRRHVDSLIRFEIHDDRQRPIALGFLGLEVRGDHAGGAIVMSTLPDGNWSHSEKCVLRVDVISFQDLSEDCIDTLEYCRSLMGESGAAFVVQRAIDHLRETMIPNEPSSHEIQPLPLPVPAMTWPVETPSSDDMTPQHNEPASTTGVWRRLTGMVARLLRTSGPAETDSRLAEGDRQAIGKTPTVERRVFQQTLAASIAGACTGTWLLTSKLHADVHAENVDLRRRQNEIDRFVGAFLLANDDPLDGRIGPAALLSGPDTVTVTGLVDPSIIERVVIEWGPGDPEVVTFPATDESGVAITEYMPFSRPHSYQAAAGQVLRVRVQAKLRKGQDARLTRLGRSSKWLTRHAEFLATPYGLVVKSDQEGIVFNLPSDGRLTQDRFALHGSIHGKHIDAMLVVLFRAPDAKLYLLNRPIRVRGDEQIPMLLLDFHPFYSGEGTLQFLLLPNKSPALAALEKQDLTEPLAAEPASLRRQDIRVTLDLPPRAVRVWQWIRQIGGSAKAHGGDWITDEALVNARTEWQEVWLGGCPIRDISMLRGLASLQGLSVAQTLIGDGALHDIAREHPQLMWLYLGSTNITDNAIKDDLLKCRNLTVLDLQNVRAIGNDSIMAIAGAGLSDLNFLNVSNTGVTSVIALRDLKSLKTLHLKGCRVSDEEVAELSKLRPDLEIRR